MGARLTWLVLLSAAACGRTFSAPGQNQTPPHVRIDSINGQPLAADAPVPVVGGRLTLHVVQDRGGPISSIDFWTPGRPHEQVSLSDGTWETDTAELFPAGGVMTVDITPFDTRGTAASATTASFIIDNAPPTIELLAPATDAVVRPGPVHVVACARDRAADTAISVTINDAPGTAAPESGAGCFAAEIPESQFTGGVVVVTVVARDDVGNVATQRFTFPFHRDLARLTLPQGWIETLQQGQLVANSAFADYAEAWLRPDLQANGAIHFDDGGFRLAGDEVVRAEAIPGSSGLMTEWAPDGATPEYHALRNGTLLPGSSFPDPDPDLGDRSVLRGIGVVCFMSNSLTTAPSIPLTCSDANGSFSSMPFQDDIDGGTLGLAEGYPLAVSTSGVLVQMTQKDPNDLSNSASFLARTTLPLGSGPIQIQPLPAALTGTGVLALSYDPIQTDAFGTIVGDDNVGWYRVDAATLAAVGPIDLGSANSPPLAAGPGGGMLVREADAQSYATRLRLLTASGPLESACIPDFPSELVARYDASGRLYVAYLGVLDALLHVRAYTPQGQLAWDWSVEDATVGHLVDVELDQAEAVESDVPILMVQTTAAGGGLTRFDTVYLLSRHEGGAILGGDGCTP